MPNDAATHNPDERKVRKALGFIWRGKRLYERILQEQGDLYGLTQNEIDVLLFLANNPPYDTSMDVVKYRHISKSLVSKSVASLMERGFLEAGKTAGDRRNIHLCIAQAAQNALSALQAAQLRYFEILQRSAGGEFACFIDTMCHVSDEFEKELKARGANK